MSEMEYPAAREYLDQVRRAGNYVKRLRYRLENLRMLLTDTAVHPADVPHTGSGDLQKHESIQAEIDELEREIAIAEEKEREIVKRKTFPVRPMSVEDAKIEMELLGHTFFAFVNIDTERTNVLYLRKDGDLGLLEPEA